jgi:hypothetical protein
MVTGLSYAPPPLCESGLQAYNTTTGCESRPVRSGHCFTRLRSPAVKVITAPSVVINIVLVVPTPSPLRPAMGGPREPATEDGDQSVYSPAPSGLASPSKPIVMVPPSTASLPPSIKGDSLPTTFEDACPELFEEDSLPTLEIRLHIALNVISHLNAVEEFRSLLAKELSLHEFLLDQMLLL